ncbi:ABC transmembrane type-1 domain-containing protein [Hyphomicrobiales bacterium]|nr:ABC transmembrane type-1 domain-containing protein [Hyphomicrobiales bacterium]CAH1677244.1 ABC transmembrane type-1 domain-containing protein [Hyphomicrobiales bacterium]
MHASATRDGRLGWLALPGFALLVPFFAAPVGLLIATSLQGASSEGGWNFANYREILSSGYYLAAFGRTLGLGVAIMALSAIIGLPLAYFMVRHPKWQTPLLAALAGPLFVNVVARLYGWQLLLADSGPINALVGLVIPNAEPIRFTGSMLGVCIVMLHVMLPYMVFALFNSMQSVEAAVWDAAATLGADSLATFLRVAVPLAVPGLVTGAILVFTLAVSSFVVPAVMGGGKVNTFPTLVYLEAMALNFSMAAAIAICLMVILLPLGRLSSLTKQRTS